MRPTPLFPALIFLAGLATGFLARSPVVGAPQTADTHAADLAGIEKLHQQDIEVTLSQDPKGLIDIWTDDAVRFSLDPTEPPVVGKQAIAADNRKGLAQYPGFKVLSYTPKFKSIEILGGLACELVEYEGKFKLSPQRPPDTWHAQGVRVLRRESDNTWKFAVLIWDRGETKKPAE